MGRIIQTIEAQFEAMSLEVCDRNGLTENFQSLLQEPQSTQVVDAKGKGSSK